MAEFGRTPHKKLSQGSTEVNLVTIRSKCRVTIRSFAVRSVTIRRFACIPYEWLIPYYIYKNTPPPSNTV